MSDALAFMSALVMEDGQLWGEIATDWQRADAAAVLDLHGPRMHWLGRPRGGSKTTDGAAIALAVLGLQAPPSSRSLAYAVDAGQAQILLDALRGFVHRTPGLARVFDVSAWQVTYVPTKATLTVEAAGDVAGSWGHRPYMVWADEFAVWTEKGQRLWQSIVSSLPKRPDSRLLCMTAPGDPAGWPFRVLEDARDRNQQWRVSEIPGPLPWVSAEDLEEQKRLLPESAYLRLHMGLWVSGEDRLASIEALRVCVGERGPESLQAGSAIRYVIGLDIGLKNDRTVLTVCHRDGDCTVLDKIHVLQGSSARPVLLAEVEALVRQTCDAYNRAQVIYDPWQAVGLAQRLKAASYSTVEFNFTSQSVGRLASALHLGLRDGLVSLPDDRDLIEELAAVRLRTNGAGVMRMDHASGGHDDRAQALALCVLHFAQQPVTGSGSATVPKGRVGKRDLVRRRAYGVIDTENRARAKLARMIRSG